MTTLLELREKALLAYAQYERYINMAARFLVTLLSLAVINGQIGYQKTLSGVLPTVIIALLGTVCPPNLMVVIFGLIILLHLYSLSMEAAAVGAVLFLVLLLVYLRFTPGDTMLLLLYPVCRAAGLQYALPIVGGLLFTPASGVTVAVGVIVDSFLRFVHQNETTISSAGETGSTDSMMSSLQFLMDGIMQDKAMMVLAAAVVVGTIAVYVVRRLSIPYAWIAAAGTGSLLQLVVVLIGVLTQNAAINVGLAFVGVLAGFAAGAVLSFLFFNLDYTRMEITQFEDDEYYYYVKAVPKNSLASPRRTVRTVNARKGAGGHAGARGQGRNADSYRGGREPLWEEPVYEEPVYEESDYGDTPQDEYEDEFGEDF